ncbi:hypothetical protein BU24DRAFT_412993 [Aaosphaeria arxii CBS 175.79]|uniref:Uncharacterized protein n=1 Tax=Aaosphaeria arxii CBS 175.79 TaxID=1450172 RepID=A0A6A5XEQ2_9PLEO|nr:uncharacterized protein BU24DRAFT_412993 [Aaosphaeria arxii CBS 175.79]KAF2011316.1 hypothetical protein BU24DRAFT_412993 [Aaosphaeria arxii CBS 175.79]
MENNAMKLLMKFNESNIALIEEVEEIHWEKSDDDGFEGCSPGDFTEIKSLTPYKNVEKDVESGKEPEFIFRKIKFNYKLVGRIYLHMITTIKEFQSWKGESDKEALANREQLEDLLEDLALCHAEEESNAKFEEKTRTDAERRIQEFERQASVAKAEFYKIKAELQGEQKLKEHVRCLEEELAALKGTVSTYRHKNKELESNLKSQRNDLQEMRFRLANSEAVVREYEEAAAGLRQNCEAAEQRASDLEAQFQNKCSGCTAPETTTVLAPSSVRVLVPKGAVERIRVEPVGSKQQAEQFDDSVENLYNVGETVKEKKRRPKRDQRKKNFISFAEPSHRPEPGQPESCRPESTQSEASATEDEPQETSIPIPYIHRNLDPSKRDENFPPLPLDSQSSMKQVIRTTVMFLGAVLGAQTTQRGTIGFIPFEFHFAENVEKFLVD